MPEHETFNQAGSHPTKWDRSGIVVDTKGNDQYLVKIDGSGRLSRRNRRFLRRFTAASPDISYPNMEPPTIMDNDGANYSEDRHIESDEPPQDPCSPADDSPAPLLKDSVPVSSESDAVPDTKPRQASPPESTPQEPPNSRAMMDSRPKRTRKYNQSSQSRWESQYILAGFILLVIRNK